MTNLQIILNGCVENGLYTKEQIEDMLQNGVIPNIHTFKEWKKRGYSVKKGQKAKMCLYIWRFTAKNEEVDLDNEDCLNLENVVNDGLLDHYYKTKAFFFNFDQVEKIEG